MATHDRRAPRALGWQRLSERSGRGEIHIGARIVAVADAFDVMTSARVLQEADPRSRRPRGDRPLLGLQFDPAVVRAFLNIGLRRLQFALGPLAWLSNLPIFGQAPLVSTATNAIGGVVTASVLTAATLGSAAAADSPRHQSARTAEVAAARPAPATTTVSMSSTMHSSIGDGRPTTTDIGSASVDPTASDATVPATTAQRLWATRDNNSVTGLADDHNRAVDAGSPVRRPDPSGAGHHQPSDTAPAAPAPPPTVAPATTAAPATTIPPTTTAAPTTTAPGTATQALYLTAASAGDHAFSATKPAMVGATEPDVDGDGHPGLTLKHGASHTIAWATPVDLGGHLQGQVTLDLFSGVNNFNRTEQQTMTGDLQMCDAVGLNCVSIVSNTWVNKPWAVGGVNTWSERQLVLGTVDTIVPPTFKLRLVLTAIERTCRSR